MLKRLFTCILVSYLTVTPLQADFDDLSVSAQSVSPAEGLAGHRRQVRANGNFVSRAKLHNTHQKRHQFLRYREAEVELDYLFYFSPCFEEGLNGGLSFNWTQLGWKDNPFFKKENFKTVSVELGVFTHRLHDWLWRAQATINLDVDHVNIGQYSTYDFLFWGKYEYREDIGVHVGLWAETGMRIDWVYPIFGFDWKINPKWKLNAVFPVNVSLVYQIADCWTASLAGRFFDSRHRADRNSNLRGAIVTYRAAAAEAVLGYDCQSWLQANVHAGYNFGGKFIIANSHYNHKRHFNFDAAPYIGGEASIRF